MNNNYLSGKNSDIAIGAVVIPYTMVSNDTSFENFEEQVREIETLGGMVRQATGDIPEAAIQFSFYVPSWDYIGENILPHVYNTGMSSGNITYGDGCNVTVNSTKLNISPCNSTNDADDIHIGNAMVTLSGIDNFNSEDAMVVQVMVYANPGQNGEPRVRIGTGDLAQESVYDPITQTTVAVT